MPVPVKDFSPYLEIIPRKLEACHCINEDAVHTIVSTSKGCLKPVFSFVPSEARHGSVQVQECISIQDGTGWGVLKDKFVDIYYIHSCPSPIKLVVD